MTMSANDTINFVMSTGKAFEAHGEDGAKIAALSYCQKYTVEEIMEVVERGPEELNPTIRNALDRYRKQPYHLDPDLPSDELAKELLKYLRSTDDLLPTPWEQALGKFN